MKNPYDMELEALRAEMENLKQKRERDVSALVKIAYDLRFANTSRKERKRIVKAISVLIGQIHWYDTIGLGSIQSKMVDVETKRAMLEYTKCRYECPK